MKQTELKIGILGTRGIPNYHGGFEQFAEYFSVYLAKLGHQVFVYNSSSHPYKESVFNEVKIIHCKDPESKIGTIGQFIYDFNCIVDSRKRNFDILLQLGYTSSSIWSKLLPAKSIIITNMDGLEWKRAKYSKLTQRFLKFAEKLAVKNSDKLISDSIGIQDYLFKKYKVESKYIAYGASLFNNPDPKILKKYNVKPFEYNILIARMEPENNIETILDGISLSKTKLPFLVVGKNDVNNFGKYLTKKFKDSQIRFLGGIYNFEDLNNLRYYSNLYFHGHSVGGTNPSLLEAMASKALIIAHKNEFNATILKENAFYFSTKEEVKEITESIKKQSNQTIIENNFDIIKNDFNWDKINGEYLDFFHDCI